MDAKIAAYKSNSLDLCHRLLRELDRNKDDSFAFFGEGLRRVYIDATDEAFNKTIDSRHKISNL